MDSFDTELTRAKLRLQRSILGFLIKHYAGNFPLWLTPDQVRVDADFSATPFKAKITDAEKPRVHTMLVIGGRDMEAGAVSVRLHTGGPQGAKPKAEVVADILASIKERRA